jgi:hypothetical protein
VIRLVADANISQRFVAACRRLDSKFPILHIADWEHGRHRESKDSAILQALKIEGLILVSFDRRTMAMHAAELTRAGGGHAGVILFRRSVAQTDYGKQSRLVVEFWSEAATWDWSDRIQYLP